MLIHVEERYTFYRSPEGLRRGNLVAAWFDHATSRNLDPQLHTHVFFLNMVQTSDGGWKAIWIKPVLQDQKSLGLLFRQQPSRVRATHLTESISERLKVNFEQDL